MAINLRSGTSSNLAVIEPDGAIRTAARTVALTATTAVIGAGATGVLGPVDVSAAGNVSFIVKGTVAATGWTGSPVIVFEQSDDGVSWTPVVAVRSDTQQALSTHVLGPGAANTSVVFDAALEGVGVVRARLTAGTTAGSLTLVAQPGTLAFIPNVSLSQPLRTPVQLFGTSLPVGTSGVETLLTPLTQVRGSVSTSSPSFTPAAGKRLAIQTVVLTQVGNATATATTSVFRMRYNPGGAATVTSTPVLLQTRVTAPGTALSFTQAPFTFPNCWELAGDGVASFAFTAASTYTTNAPTVDVLLVGYEY